MTAESQTRIFYGWHVVGAASVLAVFGWGVGFYGPPVFLSVVQETRGWPVALVSAAVTVHFLVGAVAGGNLPVLHRRYGVKIVTKAGALVMNIGVFGWATATAPWQLFIAAGLSGAGWGAMSAAALNAIIAPWFVRSRPAALAMAYNGASLGAIIFAPLWVAAISALGFPMAVVAIGIVMVITMWALSDLVFSRTPEAMGLRPDGDQPNVPMTMVTAPSAQPLPGTQLWHNRQFLTLTAGMALGLFAQVGLVAHLYSLLAPTFGAQQAGFAMALVTAMAIIGRTLFGWLMPLGADRRLAACLGYAAQLAGSVAFVFAAGTNVPLLVLGIVLFGVGFGNATSLPPLIAQVEFVNQDLQSAVALVVAIAQGAFAFAPAVFGLIRSLAPPATDAAPADAPILFGAAALVQGLAVCAFLAGRRRSQVD